MYKFTSMGKSKKRNDASVILTLFFILWGGTPALDLLDSFEPVLLLFPSISVIVILLVHMSKIRYTLHKRWILKHGDKVRVIAEKNAYCEQRNYAQQYLVCKGYYNGEEREFKTEGMNRNLSYFIGTDFTVYINPKNQSDYYVDFRDMKRLKKIVKEKRSLESED